MGTFRMTVEIAGDAATGLKAITAELDPANHKSAEVLSNFKSRYDYISLPWYMGSAYDDVYITAECLKQTEDDQDADGFRDCLYGITWTGAIGTNYGFDDKGEVQGTSQQRRGGAAVVRADRREQGVQAHPYSTKAMSKTPGITMVRMAITPVPAAASITAHPPGAHENSALRFVWVAKEPYSSSPSPSWASSYSQSAS